jgi:2'-5' RNA ligase
VQFNLSSIDALKVLEIPVDGMDFAPKMRDMQPHVTVLFGFHAEVTSQDLNAITKGIGSVDVLVGPIITFPPGPDGVPLVISVESEKLRKLNADLKTLPHTETWPDYKPHICIAYLKPEAAEKYQAVDNPLQGQIFTLSNLVYSGIDYNVQELEKLMLPSHRLRRITET